MRTGPLIIGIIVLLAIIVFILVFLYVIRSENRRGRGGRSE